MKESATGRMRYQEKDDGQNRAADRTLGTSGTDIQRRRGTAMEAIFLPVW